MTFNRLIASLFIVAGLLTMVAPAGAQEGLDPENTIYLDLKDGRVTIKLRPDLAPLHVERIKTLTRQGFYDGLTFHRVIPEFMAQTGDPLGTGRGSSSLPDLPAEFSSKSKARFITGVLGMARGRSPNSANSQFFIMFAPAPHLDEKYTIWGQVIDGMEFVNNIKKGSPHAEGKVLDGAPDKIVRMQVAADAKQ